MSENNIVFRSLPELSWASGEQRASLEALAGYVTDEAKGAIGWYLAKKGIKSRGARVLRVGAIFFVALAGAIPLLAEVNWFQSDGLPIVEPILSSIALVVAGTCVGLDHFFGFSSAWMRFLKTEMQIRRALHEFLLDWEVRRAAWPEAGPGAAEIEAGIGSCKTFLAQVNGLLTDEMDTWIREFSAALETIDQATRAREETMRLGSANIVVDNGTVCTDGWRLTVDDGAETAHRGTSAALWGLMPGPHAVRVRGSTPQGELQAAKAFMVTAGSTVEVTLSLA